jgi:hypothetical protein
MTAGPVQLVERSGPGEVAAEEAELLTRWGLGAVRRLPDGEPAGAPLVYHATDLDRALPLHLATATTGPVVVVAHGLPAPPDPMGLLARLAPAWARDLAVSAAALGVLAPRVRAVVAHDGGTAIRATAAGWPPATVVAPPAAPAAWRTAEPVAATVHHVAETMRGTVVVCEAALSPLAPVVELIEAFHVLATWHDPRARLVVTGPVPLPPFARLLHRWTERLALGSTWLAGVMEPGEQRPVFERADVAVVLPGHAHARVRAAAAGIPAVDLDGTPLDLAERLAAAAPGGSGARSGGGAAAARAGDPGALARLVDEALA